MNRVKQKEHSVKYNFIMNFILTASQFIFPLITFPYVSRVLMSSGNGKIAFASSVANYFAMVASLGIPTYGIRACAQVKDNKDNLSKTVQELFMINAIITAVVLITYFVSIILIPKFQEEKLLFYINAVNILLNTLGMNWLFQGLEKYDYITIRSIIFKIISIILMLGFVHKQSDYILYGAITVFAAVGSNILNLTQLHKYIYFKKYSNYNLKKHLKPIFILFSQSMVVSIYTNLDTVMLGFIKNSEQVGLYNAAIKLKSLLLSLVTSLSNVLLPRMSYYYKIRKMDEFKELAAKAINFTMCISLPICTYFILYAKQSILFLAGEGYLEAVLAMQFVVFAVIPNGLTGVLGVQVLTAQNKEKYVLYSVLIGAISDFILNLILIPKYGASGAAFATMVAEYLVLVVQIMFTRKLLQNIRNEIRCFYYFIGIILATVVSIFVKNIVNVTSNFIILCITGMVFLGIYFIILVIKKDFFVKSLLSSVKINKKR